MQHYHHACAAHGPPFALRHYRRFSSGPLSHSAWLCRYALDSDVQRIPEVSRRQAEEVVFAELPQDTSTLRLPHPRTDWSGRMARKGHDGRKLGHCNDHHNIVSHATPSVQSAVYDTQVLRTTLATVVTTTFLHPYHAIAGVSSGCGRAAVLHCAPASQRRCHVNHQDNVPQSWYWPCPTEPSSCRLAAVR